MSDEQESRPQARAAIGGEYQASQPDLGPIIQRDGRMSKPPKFAQVPLGVILDYQLQLQQLRLLMLMLAYTERREDHPNYMHARPSTRILSRRLGLSRRTVGRLLVDLQRMGYVESHSRRKAHPKLGGDPNALCYAITLPEEWSEDSYLDWILATESEVALEGGAQDALIRATSFEGGAQDAVIRARVARSKGEIAPDQTIDQPDAMINGSDDAFGAENAPPAPFTLPKPDAPSDGLGEHMRGKHGDRLEQPDRAAPAACG